jgi:hypothetical protein
LIEEEGILEQRFGVDLNAGVEEPLAEPRHERIRRIDFVDELHAALLRDGALRLSVGKRDLRGAEHAGGLVALVCEHRCRGVHVCGVRLRALLRELPAL